jgi:hypothetical protein
MVNQIPPSSSTAQVLPAYHTPKRSEITTPTSMPSQLDVSVTDVTDVRASCACLCVILFLRAVACHLRMVECFARSHFNSCSLSLFSSLPSAGRARRRNSSRDKLWFSRKMSLVGFCIISRESRLLLLVQDRASPSNQPQTNALLHHF